VCVRVCERREREREIACGVCYLPPSLGGEHSDREREGGGHREIASFLQGDIGRLRVGCAISSLACGVCCVWGVGDCVRGT